jgi:hypothetical protein
MRCWFLGEEIYESADLQDPPGESIQHAETEKWSYAESGSFHD